MSVILEKFTFGVGDRFAHQAKAQLQAFIQAEKKGVDITPVWNKSNREHLIVGSEPESLSQAANRAVAGLAWQKSHYIDADHINLDTVDRFLSCSDFFTIDVADSIGQQATSDKVEKFLDTHPELIGTIAIEGIGEPFSTSRAQIGEIAATYLLAVNQAGLIYDHIQSRKGSGNFATEISMDETDNPQTPPELLVILAAIADRKIPLQTIAPKFSGRFNKGVDYVGDVSRFEQEFNDDLAVIEHAVKAYGLPDNLKLSVHSGSDKFSIYPAIRKAIIRFDAGLHVKTAGTTWLEEIIGLAEAGGNGLILAREIYAEALADIDALCAPYATVIDIDRSRLPESSVVENWSGAQFVSALRHDPGNPDYNQHLRQLLHVGFKVAAKMGSRYTNALQEFEPSISANVTENLFQRHMQPLFIG
ncbi:MAG: tagaturonate epimerase family protein [Verrucomicrobiales bacterium]|nr:tagaturonate epimerase family protein [Verrucomicrobiales bacterium]